MPSSEPTEFLRLIRALAQAEVEFVVIGGLALQVHGSGYITFDADFAIARRRENARAIADALAPFKPVPVDWPADVPFVWDEQTVFNATTMTLDTEIGRIDLLTEPDGAPPFALLKQNAVKFILDGSAVCVASIDDLISMKRASGRPKDLGHIAELETIRRLNQDD